MPRVVEYGFGESLPTIHVISDSIGLTGLQMARAAAAQYGEANPNIRVLSLVETFDQIVAYIERLRVERNASGKDEKLLIFYTLVNAQLAKELIAYARDCGDIYAVDLISKPIAALGEISGKSPLYEAGGLREPSQEYFRRIEAIEFTIEHDDGRNPQDLPKADIVLIGVSRSSKTPTSIYLALEGYRVANVPLDPDTAPPPELDLVEQGRLYGLVTSPEILMDVRKQRLGRQAGVVSRYADYEYVCKDLEMARDLMRKHRCRVIHTENRAVEETAQEILRYYERAFGPEEIQDSGF